MLPAPPLAARHGWAIGLALALAVAILQVHLLDPPWSTVAFLATQLTAAALAWAAVLGNAAYRKPAALVAVGFTLVAVGDAVARTLDWLGMHRAGLMPTDLI